MEEEEEEEEEIAREIWQDLKLEFHLALLPVPVIVLLQNREQTRGGRWTLSPPHPHLLPSPRRSNTHTLPRPTLSLAPEHCSPLPRLTGHRSSACTWLFVLYICFFSIFFMFTFIITFFLTLPTNISLNVFIVSKQFEKNYLMSHSTSTRSKFHWATTSFKNKVSGDLDIIVQLSW